MTAAKQRNATHFLPRQKQLTAMNNQTLHQPDLPVGFRRLTTTHSPFLVCRLKAVGHVPLFWLAETTATITATTT